MAEDIIIRGVREQIASRIRGDVLAGRLHEGQRLSELNLAKRFGVSRGPIREALVQLIHEGLLVAKPHCGVKVAAAAPDAIRRLVVPIRRTIETYALRLIFVHLDEDDFAAWSKILDRMKLACQRRDIPTAIEQDIAFHRYLLERAGQPDLLAIWATIVARIRDHFWHIHERSKNQPIDVYADHSVLIEAFRLGDERAAVKALRAHIV